MTNQEHPITPPPELVQQWLRRRPVSEFAHNYLAAQAARWGADQELEACCEWFANEGYGTAPDRIRAARRPKPPSLKEQALAKLAAMERLWEASGNEPSDLVRRALEALPE